MQSLRVKGYGSCTTASINYSSIDFYDIDGKNPIFIKVYSMADNKIKASRMSPKNISSHIPSSEPVTAAKIQARETESCPISIGASKRQNSVVSKI
jgi:hypothetical protein